MWAEGVRFFFKYSVPQHVQLRSSQKQFAVFLFKFENVNNESSVALAEGLKLTGDIAY